MSGGRIGAGTGGTLDLGEIYRAEKLEGAGDVEVVSLL